ncbi:MAG TPA: hypothetical protein PLP56_04165 [Candidatus Omnitrophota bacterium]|nr:hypothetical protein [Candidatus Omnitrophota bacterium]HNQ50603.1 hypothetical protein [Candidatus Omnitrophota bacterium]HQO38215.1 hypothetical protein [Candidatus Omnitrophota bacterium]HQQ06158.1 hypothetical protein [Candidatus Omnitrophota bacterium]
MADINPAQASGQQAAQPAAAASPAPKKAGAAGLAELKDRVMSAFKAGSGPFDIGLVNRGLIAVIGIMIVFAATGSSSAWRELRELSIKEFTVSPAAKSEAGFKEIATMKGVAYYIGKLAGRDIFSRKPRQDDLSKEPVFSTKMADMTASLKLVGISMSDNPDAMIEDTKLQKTYFVKTGSTVGDLRVDLITKDKVVLKYNKELFELR